MSDRAALVAAATSAWSAALLDVSRRNNLLYYRETQATLSLDDLDAEELAALLAGDKVVVRHLLKKADANAEKRVSRLAAVALAYAEEKGLETLHLGVGMVTWRDEGGGRPPAAPALLVPVALTRRPGGPLDWALACVGEPQVNPALLTVLARAHHLPLSAESILPPIASEEANEGVDEDLGRRLAMGLDRLTKQAAPVPGFAMDSGARVLAHFVFHKLALVRDLEAAADLAQSDLVAAMAGDPQARQQLGRGIPGEPIRDTVLDADASQREVLAFGMQSLVVQGPPGTGKSQTIANLIAELAAAGKRVLFVAEKRAALEAVARRLEDPSVGLGRLLLDLHGAELTRRAVLDRVAEGLAELKATPRVPESAGWAARDAAAAKLDAHAKAEGEGRYAVRLRLMENAAPDLGLRVRGAQLSSASAAKGPWVEQLGQVAPDLLQGESPWSGAKVTADKVEEVANLLNRLSSADWKGLARRGQAWADACGLPACKGPGALWNFLLQADAWAGFFETCDPKVFDRDLKPVVTALRRAEGGVFHVMGGVLFDSAFRDARAFMRSVNKIQDGSAVALLRLAEQAETLRGTTPAAEIPKRGQRDADLQREMRGLWSDLAALQALLPPLDLAEGTWEEWQGEMRDLLASRFRLAELPVAHALQQSLADVGLAGFPAACRAAGLPVSAWPAALERILDQSLLEDAALRDPNALGFRAEAHEAVRATFRTADRAALGWRQAEIRRRHAARVVEQMNAFPTQEALLRREAAKKARHLPLRRLMAEAGEVLTALCPCVMASPLSVSQLLPASRGFFDVVVFDEASQIMPEDAVPSLYRAKAMVVAGDSRQMPPTRFFSAAGDGEDTGDTPEATAGFESLLDVAVSFLPERTLAWHYRSRDDRLIAFSNARIYGRRLVTFPGCQSASPLSLVQVSTTGTMDGESSQAEVTRVVELVLAHAVERPQESLGVIAFGLTHAGRLQVALDAALATRPELGPWFAADRPDRFFIKNLERVQGDERDAIVLSVGYAKDATGRLPHRFGPLNQSGGERRLNVAITRAKRRMTVVSSFGASDMDPARCQAAGAAMLRDFLAFAAAPHALAGEREPIVLDALERRIVADLSARGLTIAARLGTSSNRLGLAVAHPTSAGQWVLAVETDGPGYAEYAEARDRDRLREQVLAGLGWLVHRVWAAEWQRDPAAASERLWQACQAAVHGGGTPASPSVGSDPIPDPPVSGVGGRRPRLQVRPGLAIGDYTDAELQSVLAWVKAEGGHFSDEELLTRMVAALGFSRRGPRIEARFRQILLKNA